MSGPTVPRAAIAALGLLSLGGYALDLHRLFGRDLAVLRIYVALFLALHAIYLLAAWVALRRARADRLALGLVLGFALAFRLAALPAPVVSSSDVYRYLWDGRVQAAGINPYRYAPDAPELAALRDARIHASINRPSSRTVYPPGAQLVFALVGGLAPDSILSWRLFLLASEVTTGVLLLRLLARLGRPAIAVIIYAWSPLAIFEGLHAGHLDVVLLPPLLIALLWRQQGRLARAGTALGVAIALKLYPAALALAWWRRGDWKLPAAAAGVVAAAYAPYAIGVGSAALGFLPEYVTSSEDFNVGLRFFVTAAFGLEGPLGRAVAMATLATVLLAVLLIIRGTLGEEPLEIVATGRAAVAAWLVLVPTALHPWYAIWILPFVAVVPSTAWCWFTGAVSLSYLGYLQAPTDVPLWVRLIEFVPLYVLLGLEVAPRLSWMARAVARG